MATIKENQVVLTAEGRAKLEEELKYLEGEKREEVGERIRVAREFGDISENSEYDDAKNEQAMIESRIIEIRNILATAVEVASPTRNSKVSIGSFVTLVDANGTQREVQIVGSAEANAREGKISNESPVGAAALGKKKGESFTISTPSGKTITYTIEKIARK